MRPWGLQVTTSVSYCNQQIPKVSEWGAKVNNLVILALINVAQNWSAMEKTSDHTWLRNIATTDRDQDKLNVYNGE